jgi:uncharacterized protein YjbI with pentapeptide repeats
VVGWVLAAAGVLAVLLLVVFVVPRLLYPPLPAARFAGVAPDKRIELETNRLKLQNDARATLLQALAGGVLLLGVYFTWRQLGVTREGQITDRYTKAVDQLGSEHLDVRVGGIYALERIAYDSPPDRATIEEVLTAYLRDHAPWPPPLVPPPPALPPLQAVTHGLVILAQRQRAALQRRRAKGTAGQTQPGRTDEQAAGPPQPAADVQAAVVVLGRRQLPPDGLRELDLTRVDLRRARLDYANFHGARLDYANLQGAWLADANLQDAWLVGANLEHAALSHANFQDAQLDNANLQHAHLDNTNLQRAVLSDANLQQAWLFRTNLQGAELFRANLQGAGLAGANLQDAQLKRTNLQRARLFDANLRGAQLDDANLQDAVAGKDTRWPDGFDPQAAGVTIEDVAGPGG